MAEDAWNTRDPWRVALAYTSDSRWRNRTEFPVGREQIFQFLTRKWQRELEYRLIKELWAFADDRISVRFAYEWRDDADNWFRSYGNEQWEFDARGLMRRRYASINDLPIAESDRKRTQKTASRVPGKFGGSANALRDNRGRHSDRLQRVHACGDQLRLRCDRGSPAAEQTR
ncbi:MAG: nuclear transport factor 2 family protein [Woeseia sp.]